MSTTRLPAARSVSTADQLDQLRPDHHRRPPRPRPRSRPRLRLRPAPGHPLVRPPRTQLWPAAAHPLVRRIPVLQTAVLQTAVLQTAVLQTAVLQTAARPLCPRPACTMLCSCPVVSTPDGRSPGTSRAERGRSRAPVASTTALARTRSSPCGVVTSALPSGAQPVTIAPLRTAPRGRHRALGQQPGIGRTAHKSPQVAHPVADVVAVPWHAAWLPLPIQHQRLDGARDRERRRETGRARQARGPGPDDQHLGLQHPGLQHPGLQHLGLRQRAVTDADHPRPHGHAAASTTPPARWTARSSSCDGRVSVIRPSTSARRHT